MSWAQLTAIAREATDVVREEHARALTECPECATVLNVNGLGLLSCPLGDWAQEG